MIMERKEHGDYNLLRIVSVKNTLTGGVKAMLPCLERMITDR